jgi:hypothetical protein
MPGDVFFRLRMNASPSSRLALSSFADPAPGFLRGGNVTNPGWGAARHGDAIGSFADHL